MIQLLALLTLLTSTLVQAKPADNFVLRVHLPKVETTCEFRFAKNTEILSWANIPSHWVHLVPLASTKTPSEWETDPKKLRVFHEVDQIRMNQSTFTLVPEGLRNTYKHKHGELLQAMFGENPRRPFPDFYVQTQKFYHAQSPEDQHLIREALAILELGENGDLLNVRPLLQYADGRMLRLASGFMAILPDRTAPRGLLVMPYLESPVHDFLINVHYRAGTLEKFADHYAAILPVTVERQ